METSPTTPPVTAPAGSGTKGFAHLRSRLSQRNQGTADKAVEQILADQGVRPILTVAAFQSSI